MTLRERSSALSPTDQDGRTDGRLSGAAPFFPATSHTHLINIMADLTPIPFSILPLRSFSELEHKKAAFDLPERFFSEPAP